MIKLEDRINAWATVGKILQSLSANEKSDVIANAVAENAWFTEDNIERALRKTIHYLNKEKLKAWTINLPDMPVVPKKIGLVMEGNTPLASFHDLLAVLISGHMLKGKLHLRDSFLYKYILQILCEIEPRFLEQIIWAERLNDVDALIVTSDENTKSFEHYFGSIPNMIRKKRRSCAVIDGRETTEDLKTLGGDIFSYFGLSDSNVAKLYMPEDYNFMHLLDSLAPFQYVLHHHRYNNHYDYNKSVYLVNNEPHYDTGFMLFRESNMLASPIGVMYYEFYNNRQELDAKINEIHDQLQYIYSQDGWYEGSSSFGKTQYPDLWDYAGHVDTLTFIQENL